MNDWSIPEWGEPWDPAAEIPYLRSVDDTCIGHACVSVLEPDRPHFSCYLGAAEDEFHGYNIRAAASVVGHYMDAMPDAEA